MTTIMRFYGIAILFLCLTGVAWAEEATTDTSSTETTATSGESGTTGATVEAAEEDEDASASITVSSDNATEAMSVAATQYDIGNYSEALKTYTAIYKQNGKHAPAAMYWAGQCLAALHKYQDSVNLHKAVVAKYSSSVWANQAYYRAACMTAGLLKKQQEGIRMFTKIIEKDPTHVLARDSLFNIASIHLVQGKTSQAKIEFAKVIEYFPESNRATKAKEILEGLVKN